LLDGHGGHDQPIICGLPTAFAPPSTARTVEFILRLLAGKRVAAEKLVAADNERVERRRHFSHHRHQRAGCQRAATKILHIVKQVNI
jgi:hypothetical protein